MGAGGVVEVLLYSLFAGGVCANFCSSVIGGNIGGVSLTFSVVGEGAGRGRSSIVERRGARLVCDVDPSMAERETLSDVVMVLNKPLACLNSAGGACLHAHANNFCSQLLICAIIVSMPSVSSNYALRGEYTTTVNYVEYDRYILAQLV